MHLFPKRRVRTSVFQGRGKGDYGEGRGEIGGKGEEGVHQRVNILLLRFHR